MQNASAGVFTWIVCQCRFSTSTADSFKFTDDLLDLMRITLGKLPLGVEPCDTHSLIALAVDFVRDEAHEKQIALTLDLAAWRCHLTGDPARLHQVFWNLLRHTVEFTPTGGHIRIACHNGDGEIGEQPNIRFEASDDGTGFAPADTERISNPLHQAGV